MSEFEEYVHEYNELLDYETKTPLLCGYIDTVLRCKKEIESHEDSRVLFYRGQSDKAYLLTPSVFRNGLLSKEHTLIHDLQLNSPDDFIGTDNSLERLIKMQHYKLPTRLLDVTLNPLVALYFACNENFDEDGEIIVFYDYMQRHTTVEARCLIALSEYNGSSERQMLGFLTEKGFSNLELANLTRITHIPIEAPRNNERIKRQRGAFVIVGIFGDNDGNHFQKAIFNLKPLLVREFNDGIPRSIIIPKDEKKQLLKELDALGINHAFLFPELEHQATYIRNKYEEA